MYVIQMIGWIVCGVYATIPLFWLIIHPFTDFWRKRYRAPLKPLALIWIVLWIVLWSATAHWRNATLPISGWWSLLAIPCWTITCRIYLSGHRHFSLDHFIGRKELESDRQPQILVTTGLHARMRHPIYFGHLCTMLGWFALVRTEAVLGLLIFAVISGTFMIRAEDAELEQRFGDPYRQYRTQVPAVIPKL